MSNQQTLRAYHGDPAIKAKYIDRIRAHRAAEHLTQGIGWESDGLTRGCAVGCTLENYDHSLYPIELGLPEWLAHLEDCIFEGLPTDLAQAWPESFLEAITPGVDVEVVLHRLAMRRMDRLIALQTSLLGKHPDRVEDAIKLTIASLHQVRACHEAEAGGNICDMRSAAESAAESAAWSAAWSDHCKWEAETLLALLRNAPQATE